MRLWLYLWPQTTLANKETTTKNTHYYRKLNNNSKKSNQNGKWNKMIQTKQASQKGLDSKDNAIHSPSCYSAVACREFVSDLFI